MYEQVTWLVVTEVRSQSFGLVTERRHYSARPIYYGSGSYVRTVLFSSSSVVSRAFCALYAYSTFGHHPHPLRYRCAKFRFFRGLHCWASPWRKIAYSITQLIWYTRDRSFRFGKISVTVRLFFAISWKVPVYLTFAVAPLWSSCVLKVFITPI